MKNNFDLTTVDGLNQAQVFLRKYWEWLLFPVPMTLKTLVDWLGSPSDVSPEKQAEAAVRIIQGGQKHGARKIKMKVDKSVGASVKAKIDNLGVDIGGSVGSDGKMELEIEYK